MSTITNEKSSFKYDLIVLAVFLIIGIAFCIPAFQGYVLNQHDTYSYIYASQEARAFYEKTGEYAAWGNGMFGGMPQLMLEFDAEGNWFRKISTIIQMYSVGMTHNPAVLFIMSMVCFYILSCSLGLKKWLGALGAIAFAFSTYNPIIIAAGHVTKMIDIAYLPAILGGVIYAYKGKVGLGMAIVGLVLPMFIDAGHFQIIYYGAIVILVMIVAATIILLKKGKMKQWLTASVGLGVVALLALAVNYNRLIQVQNFSKHTIRGGASELATGAAENDKGLDKEYAFSWSNDIGETMCLMVPNLYGGSSSEDIGEDSEYAAALKKLGVPANQALQMAANAPTYWGPQPFLSGPIYFGAIVCFLFILSMFVVRSKLKWWALGIAIFFIVLSVGKNLEGINYFLFDYFPMMNKFRAPTQALSVVSIIFPLMGIWAIRDLIEGRLTKEEQVKALKYGGIVSGAIIVLILLGTQGMFNYVGEGDDKLAQQFGQAADQIMSALRADRASMALSDTVRSLIFIALAYALLHFYLKEKLSKTMLIGGISVLMLADLLPVAHRYLNKEKHYITEQQWEAKLKPNNADREILKDTELYYRVFDVTVSPFNDARGALFHKMVGGYSAAKLQIYQDLIERQLGNMNGAVLNMLNTKYFVVPGQNNQPMVQRNPGALGNAWFVNNIKVVNSAEEEMNALNAPSLSNPNVDSASIATAFDPTTTAIVRADRMDKVGATAYNNAQSGIRLSSYGPTKLTYDVQAAQEGFAVFSDIYYPEGWTAKIDGKEAEIIRTNYVLRGLKIPAGAKQVEFTFELPGFKTYDTLALVGSIVLLLIIGGGVFLYIKKERAATPIA